MITVFVLIVYDFGCARRDDINIGNWVALQIQLPVIDEIRVDLVSTAFIAVSTVCALDRLTRMALGGILSTGNRIDTHEIKKEKKKPNDSHYTSIKKIMVIDWIVKKWAVRALLFIARQITLHDIT